MDTDNEDTLVEISDKVDSLEKPKRKATPRQLESLAKARQVRAESKQKELQEEEKYRKSLPTYTKDSDIEPMLPKDKKAHRKAKPTIIQFQETDDESDDDAPTIIIKNKKRAPAPAPLPPPPVPIPVPVVEPIQQKPKQYIRKAY
jgi:hypothetical protein